MFLVLMHALLEQDKGSWGFICHLLQSEALGMLIG